MAPVIEIHLIVPITTKGVRTLEEVAHLTGPSLKITSSTIDSGPPSIECRLDEAFALPSTLVRVREAERNGAHAVIIDCFSGLGLDAAREAVAIPVLGPGEIAMHHAAMLGHSFSIVTVLDSVRPMLIEGAARCGLAGKLASVRTIDIPVLEISERYGEVKTRLAAEALRAVREDGAHVIVLGCTGFLGCAESIKACLEAQGYRLPVVDPTPITVGVAETWARAGLTHSRLTYPTPRPKTYTGHSMPPSADH